MDIDEMRWELLCEEGHGYSNLGREAEDCNPSGVQPMLKCGTGTGGRKDNSGLTVLIAK